MKAEIAERDGKQMAGCEVKGWREQLASLSSEDVENRVLESKEGGPAGTKEAKDAKTRARMARASLVEEKVLITAQQVNMTRGRPRQADSGSRTQQQAEKEAIDEHDH